MKLGICFLSALMAFTNPVYISKVEYAKLKEKALFVEYGHTITSSDLYSILEFDTKPKSIELSVSGDLEQDKAYYPVGVYEASIVADDMTYSIYLEVDDTTSPKLSSKQIEVDQGYSGDLTELLSVEELSSYTASINTSKINFNEVGQYKAKVKLIDDYYNVSKDTITVVVKTPTVATTNMNSIPAYSGSAYVTLNNNVPDFTDYEVQEATVSYEYYSPLDNLGRAQSATASIAQDLMPTTKRGSISSVTPTGWKNKKYSNVSGGWLYNRCHLIGYQLTGQNANNKNLITGTRYLNIDGMLPFENQVAQYVKSTSDHVLYRVTPIYEGNNLLASGVHMEACSVADHCQSVGFNIYAYNVQPGINIDYSTGASSD